MIDAREGRVVKTVDVPGAFIQADMPDLVHVHFTREMVNKLIEIDKEMYEPCMVIEWGDRVLYMELLKALYGTVKAAWLFWERLAKHLVSDW